MLKSKLLGIVVVGDLVSSADSTVGLLTANEMLLVLLTCCSTVQRCTLHATVSIINSTSTSTGIHARYYTAVCLFNCNNKLLKWIFTRKEQMRPLIVILYHMMTRIHLHWAGNAADSAADVCWQDWDIHSHLQPTQCHTCDQWYETADCQSTGTHTMSHHTMSHLCPVLQNNWLSINLHPASNQSDLSQMF